MTVVIQIALVDDALCGDCGGCVAVCPTNAIYLSPSLLEIDEEQCSGCGDCVVTCPVGALKLANG